VVIVSLEEERVLGLNTYVTNFSIGHAEGGRVGGEGLAFISGFAGRGGHYSVPDRLGI
jgi:hypothetical protein